MQNAESVEGSAGRTPTWWPLATALLVAMAAAPVAAQTLGADQPTLSGSAPMSTAESWDDLMAAGERARRERRYTDAHALFARAQRLRPDDSGAAMQIAVTHEWAGQLEAAQRTYETLLKRVPEEAAAWVSLGRVLRWRSDFDAALRAYREGLRLMTVAANDPLRVQALLGVALIQVETYELDEAWRGAQAVLALSPQEAEALKLMQRLLTLHQDRLSVTLGRRGETAGPSSVAQIEWQHHRDSMTKLLVGAGRGLSVQATTLATQQVVVSANTVYVEASRQVPERHATVLRLQWQDLSDQGSTWRADANTSIKLGNSRWRTHGGLSQLQSDATKATTLQWGLSPTLTHGLDAAFTAYWGREQSASGTTTRTNVGLVRIGWAQDGHALQAFWSRPFAGGASNVALVGKVKPTGWPTLLMSWSRDGATGQRQAMLGAEFAVDRATTVGLRHERIDSSGAWLLSASRGFNGLSRALRND